VIVPPAFKPEPLPEPALAPEESIPAWEVALLAGLVIVCAGVVLRQQLLAATDKQDLEFARAGAAKSASDGEGDEHESVENPLGAAAAMDQDVEAVEQASGRGGRKGRKQNTAV